jgi:hypothetical protein
VNVKRKFYRNYGRLSGGFSGADSVSAWERLVFAGIDFSFENREMVRIGIPGRQLKGLSYSVVEFCHVGRQSGSFHVVAPL